MRRLIKLITILLILGQVYSINAYAQNLKRRGEGKVARKGSLHVTAPSASFGLFPQGQRRSVSLNIEEDYLRQFSSRERLDQARDWLLFTIISSIGLPPARVDEILYDLQTSRHGYLQPVSQREYGPRRSRYVDGQNVVALLPAETADQRAHDLAHIADKHRNDTGEIPPIIQVFEYTIDLQTRAASIIRRDEVQGQDLYTPQYGYFEDRVKSRQDLERFLGRVDDLTFARMDAEGLTLGGRKIQGYRGISLENVATVWVAGRELKSKRDQAAPPDGKKEEEFKRRWEERIREFQARWAPKLKLADHASGQGDKSPLTPEQRKEFSQELATLIIRKRTEQRQLERELMLDEQKAAALKGIGFSLDPHYDYKGLADYFKTQIKPKLEKLALSSHAAVDAESILSAEKGLADEDEIPLLELLDDLENSVTESESALGFQLKKDILQYQIQTARYDGDSLRRTEVGMVLFYGDLLAKLWALDYKGGSPKRHIEDFTPLPDLHISPVFLPELLELPDTRLWFGPQIKGYQATDNGKALVFARNATRIYAASSNPLDPGREEEPNAEAAGFIGWWDDHFEEIARFEPEYDRLNQIMKWSLLIGWLDHSHNEASLSFLDTVKVDTSFWFPDWARKHPELRFRQWDQIGFYPKGYKGIQTEAMPTLFSRSYFQSGSHGYFAGGVSLADKDAFEKRGAFPSYKQIKKWIIRSDLDAERSAGPGGVKVLDGSEYQMAQTAPNRSRLTAIPRPGEIIRSKFAQLLGPQKIERFTVRTQNNSTITSSAGGTDFANLDIVSSENGFKLSFKGLDLERAHRLARRVSRSPNPESALRIDPDVESIIIASDEDLYFVKERSMKKWVKMNLQRPGKTYGEEWQASVGDLSRDSLQVNLSCVEEADVKAEISKAGYVAIGKGFRGAAETLAVNAEDVPEEGLRSVEITDGRSTVLGRFGPKEQVVYFSYSQVKSNLPRLGKLLSRDDLTELKRLSDVTKGVIRYTPHPLKVPREELAAVDRFLDKGNYKEAITALDRMRARYGEEEEVTLRCGLAEIGQGESQAAMATLSPLFKDPDRFYYHLDEVNARLARFEPGPDNATLGLGFNRDMNGELVLRLSHEMRGEKVRNEDIDLTKASVYVQDDPGLNRLDWSTSVNKTLHQVISGNLGTVIKAPRGSIRNYSPTVIYDSSGGGRSGAGRFYLKGINLEVKPVGGKTRITVRGPMFVCADDDDEEEDRRKKDSDEDEDCIWIVIAKAS
jgi:hypothetical protein